VRSLLGGKGAGLGDMTRAGIPVPTRFTVTTEACNQYMAEGVSFMDKLWGQVLDALKETEAETGKQFGNPENLLTAPCASRTPRSRPCRAQARKISNIHSKKYTVSVGAQWMRPYDSWVFYVYTLRKTMTGWRNSRTNSINWRSGGAKWRIPESRYNTDLTAETQRKSSLCRGWSLCILFAPMLYGGGVLLQYAAIKTKNFMCPFFDGFIRDDIVARGAWHESNTC
jgi:hypothetical protein